MLISLFTNGDFATRSNDVEADGVEDISHGGSDNAHFWSDSAATQPLSSLSGISLSSVMEESGENCGDKTPRKPDFSGLS